jgi:hypothetical protein
MAARYRTSRGEVYDEAMIEPGPGRRPAFPRELHVR